MRDRRKGFWKPCGIQRIGKPELFQGCLKKFLAKSKYNQLCNECRIKSKRQASLKMIMTVKGAKQ